MVRPQRALKLLDANFVKKFFLFIRARVLARTSRGGAERERKNPKQAHAVRAEPHEGLHPMNREIMT